MLLLNLNIDIFLCENACNCRCWCNVLSIACYIALGRNGSVEGRMEKANGKTKIEWETPLLVRFGGAELLVHGQLDDCSDGSGALGSCDNGYDPKVE